MALAWDGITTLPIEQMPPRALKLKWALAVDNYEKRYQHYCQTIQELSDFYSAHGISTIQLKGVGFSSYYPIPEHREGGDIDIYTYSADKSVMSDEEANALADNLMEEQGIKVCYENKKHSTFNFHGVPIENHKTFLDVSTDKIAVPIETVLRDNISPSTISLLKGKYNISTPSEVFNSVFISFHALKHYGVGLCLHHLCDWACLLNRCGLHIPEEVTNKYFLKIVETFTSFTNQFLGTEIKASCSEDDMERLFYEMFQSPFIHDCKSKNKLNILIYKTQRFLHYRKLRKEIVNESIIKAIWNSIIFHFQKPKTIFITK